MPEHHSGPFKLSLTVKLAVLATVQNMSDLQWSEKLFAAWQASNMKRLFWEKSVKVAGKKWLLKSSWSFEMARCRERPDGWFVEECGEDLGGLIPHVVWLTMGLVSPGTMWCVCMCTDSWNHTANTMHHLASVRCCLVPVSDCVYIHRFNMHHTKYQTTPVLLLCMTQNLRSSFLLYWDISEWNGF